ncbi:MAG: 50S ribosomal protein L4 [Candidatus Woesebacteria bacterium GW2011_GWB1_43_14]|uniref:Large ribosomal subunit protein uL4 n=1 Tax=Candidatus Woesebacteria bacterium GW2011_GWB1_43_14 TaxID=1618578 RepID=A0A0G1GEW0_9BACT|nr:MAG: 50S ribosomal protein L4 [Candidatus Woesebacteria bacterium GW2011_GWA1_39_11b]KKS78017.1 MAG: 50S ribosomal protein L4 [Candidatus Woesebacteria bacterium GW2011_GWC1_42_9]KKS97403.1 MAG: 50S ribosomal protein L4 [Candidatus Woesebacteria bacterium GW2011_GWB1_43_14]
MKINIYSTSSNAKSVFTLPKYFSEPINLKLLAQVLHVYRAHQHIGFSKTKTRGEVSLTTAKWYRQKGTGRARHGAKSAPLFVGGGIAHGPKGLKRKLTIPAKMRIKARNVALSLKAKNKKITGAVKIGDVKKTKDAAKFIEKIIKGEKLDRKKVKFTLVLSSKNVKTGRNFRNIPKVNVVRFEDLNAFLVYFGGQIIFDKEVFIVKKIKK